ncbi:MAG: potassium channel family protein [Muribaculaceae bacterium]|nr:potassium channel family protein [Muribaculaceae bacterium]
MWLPDTQFRIPDGGAVDYSGWLYYSIVTITTLGFGDYTPTGHAAQWVTALEVMLGLITIGFFLNAVGSMKSENDVETEVQRRKRLHDLTEKEKLVRNIPVILHKLNKFLSYCYAVTTPLDQRSTQMEYNSTFTLDDMRDMNKPSGLPGDYSSRSAVGTLMAYSASLSIYLDTLQSRVDLALWPQLLEDCFAFVANYQMVDPVTSDSKPTEDLAQYIRNNVKLSRDIETTLTIIANDKSGNAAASSE